MPFRSTTRRRAANQAVATVSYQSPTWSARLGRIFDRSVQALSITAVGLAAGAAGLASIPTESYLPDLQCWASTDCRPAADKALEESLSVPKVDTLEELGSMTAATAGYDCWNPSTSDQLASHIVVRYAGETDYEMIPFNDETYAAAGQGAFYTVLACVPAA